MTFSIDNPRGVATTPPLGKYVWEKPSGEQGLKELNYRGIVNKTYQIPSHHKTIILALTPIQH